MVRPNINKVLQQAKALNLEERQQFIELLRVQPAPEQPHAQTKDEQIAQTLRCKGIILTIPPKPTAEQIARFKAWRPIEMPGGSLSDELIRDRR